MATKAQADRLNIDEQIARIEKMIAERDQINQRMRWEPWQVGFTGLAAGGAMVGAMAAFLKVF